MQEEEEREEQKQQQLRQVAVKSPRIVGATNFMLTWQNKSKTKADVRNLKNAAS